jgi:hypothetical protein
MIRFTVLSASCAMSRGIGRNQPVIYGLSGWRTRWSRLKQTFAVCSLHPGSGSVDFIGEVGEEQSWLAEILKAFEIEVEDDVGELVSRDGYSIRIVLQRETSVQKAWGDESLSVSAGIAEIPPLAEPNLEWEFPRSVTVTQLTRLMAPKSGAVQQIRPAIIRPVGIGVEDRPPAYTVGRVVHKALADWECLTKPDFELRLLLERYARKEGLFKPGSIKRAVDRSLEMIGNLRRHPLFAEINAAVECFAELPFMLNTPAGVIDGVIDLLYRSQDGVWQLVDWKTEWVNDDRLAELHREHATQIEYYAQAVEQITEESPQVCLCYLNPRVRVVELSHSASGTENS